MFDITKFMAGLSPVQKAFGNWQIKDTMSGQLQSPLFEVDDGPSHSKSFLHHDRTDRSLLSQNEGVDKSLQSSSQNSRNRPNSIPIIDPDTGTEIILDGSNYRSGSLGRHEVSNLHLEPLGIKSLKNIDSDQENNKSPETLKLDPPSCPKAFKCSTPADNVTHESDLVSGVSEVTHTPGGTRHNPQVRIGSAKSGLSRMGRISGSRNRENEVLAQKINLKLVNLERDGADVVEGLDKVKNRVEGLLQEARTTVEKFGRMNDKLSGYPTASQVLVEVGDEMTLLTASLSLWQNTMLDSQEFDKKSNDSSSLNKVNEERIGERGHTQIDVKDVLLESVIMNKAEQKNVIENSFHGGNFIPIMDTLDDKAMACNNVSTFAKNLEMSSFKNKRNSDDELIVLTDTNGRLDDKPFEAKLKNKENIFYYSTSKIKKFQITDCPIPENLKLELKAAQIYKDSATERETSANNEHFAKNGKIIIEQQNESIFSLSKGKLNEYLMSEELLDFNGIPLTEQGEAEKKNNSKITEQLKDIEKAESIVVSPEGKLNLRLEKLDVKLRIQNLRSSPLKSHSQILKDVQLEKDSSKEDLAISKQIGVSDIHNISQGLKKLDIGYKGLFKFTEGCPSLFWIHKYTPSLLEFENYLEVRFKYGEGDGGGSGVGKGSLVMAKYSIDGKFYRARVEEVMVGDSAADCMLSVRYTDYGNSEVVTGKDIQSWDPELECVPDLAVSCCLAGGPEHWKQLSWNVEQLAVFHQIIGKEGGNITVELRTNLRKRKTDDMQEPMFEALVSHGGANLVESLRKHPTFDRDFGDREPSSVRVPPQNTEIGFIGDNSLSQEASKIQIELKSEEEKSTTKSPVLVDPTQQIDALKLLNLTSSPWIPPAVTPQEPGSPIPSILLRKAKSKVNDWLENKCQEVNTTSLSHAASSVKSFRAKLCSNTTRQSTDNTFPSRESFKLETFSSADEEAFKILSLPHLDTLKIMEDANGTFLYFLSMVENPGKFYIHPVQMETASLDNIHAEISRHSLLSPNECLVLPETVWALCNQFENKWYRVGIENRSSTTVSVRYIDYGSSQERIRLDSLRHLPDTWVSQLPALAVQCHLAGCSPKGKSWNHKSTEQLEKILGYKKQHRGVVVGEEGGSMGVVLLTEDHIVINQKMVEWQFAASEFMNQS